MLKHLDEIVSWGKLLILYWNAEDKKLVIFCNDIANNETHFFFTKATNRYQVYIHVTWFENYTIGRFWKKKF